MVTFVLIVLIILLAALLVVKLIIRSRPKKASASSSINIDKTTPTSQKNDGSTTWKPALIAILLVVLTFGYLIYQFNWEDIQQSKYTGITNDSEYITKNEFNAIKNGMTYSKVVSIIGSSGELSSSNSYGGYIIEIYTWWGKGALGANAMITFENGKVTSKAQAGLE